MTQVYRVLPVDDTLVRVNGTRSKAWERRGHDPRRAGFGGKRKLSAAQVLEIRKLNNHGMRYHVIAKRFGVKPQTIYSICTGLTWSSLL